MLLVSGATYNIASNDNCNGSAGVTPWSLVTTKHIIVKLSITTMRVATRAAHRYCGPLKYMAKKARN